MLPNAYGFGNNPLTNTVFWVILTHCTLKWRGELSRIHTLALAVALIALAVPCYATTRDSASNKAVLDNGIPVLAQESDGDLDAACVFINTGSAADGKDNAGLTSLVCQALLSCHPVGKYVPPAIRIEQLGGKAGAAVQSDYTCFTLVCQHKSFGEALVVLAEALTRPECSDASVGVEKDGLLCRQGLREDRLMERAYRAFMEKSYGAEPYGLDPLGVPDTVGRLGMPEMHAWLAEHCRPEEMLISVAATDASRALKQVADAFGGLQKGQRAVKGVPKAGQGSPVTESRTYEVEGSQSGAAAVIGYTAPPLGSPDYPAMKLAEALISGGMGSRAFRSLRDEDQLAYSFGSLMPPRAEVSRLAFYVATDSDKVYPAVEAVQRAVKELREGRITDEELVRAKGAAVGEISLSRETSLGRAMSAGVFELMGLSTGYGDYVARQIEKLDRRDVAKAAERYMDKYTLVVLKPGRVR